MRKHIFNAGPCKLPDMTLENTAKAVMELGNCGQSILEVSHRSADFQAVYDETVALFKEVLNIPDNYSVIFLGGGASMQFCMIPYNFLGKKAAYVNTGVWSKKAIAEAKLWGEVEVIASSEDRNFTYYPKGFQIPADVDYLHITSNNTIRGTEIFEDLDSPVPLIADMSSDICSRPIDVKKYMMIYGGCQKNLGPAGATFVIIRNDYLDKVVADRKIPTMLKYQTHVDNGSMFNTPPCINIFAVGQTLKWIKQMGGVEAMERRAIERCNALYSEFDRNTVFRAVVEEGSRSRMNIPFLLAEGYEELEKEFSIEGDVIPMSFIINNGDQDPAILINGFGEGYGDTGDHFAVTDEGKVIYTTVQEGYKEGIQWLHKLVTEDLVDPEAFTQEWSTYVAKGKNHRYGLCFTWDIANIDNNEDYVMLPALTGPDGMRNITRQNNSETSGFDRGRCVLTSSCRDTALAAAWIDQMYAPLQSPQNNWGTYGEKDSFNIFELSKNKDGGEMLKHMDLGTQSPVEVREAQSVNGPLAVLNEYYDVYVTQPEDAKWRLDNMHETYLQDMNSKYVYPNVFMSIEDTNKVSQYDTDIKKYAEQKKADWILNGGIEKEWDSYLKKMEQYGLSDYLSIKQKYFDQYQKSLSEEK